MNKSEFAPILIGKLLNIGGMLQKQGNKMLVPFGLNQQQYSIFFEIGSAGKVKQKDMVNRLQLEKANVSKVVKKLQNMELITVTIQDEDKRSSWLSVTPKGEEVLNSCMNMFRKWNSEWISTIDEKQLSSMLENLSTLQSVFKDSTQK